MAELFMPDQIMNTLMSWPETVVDPARWLIAAAALFLVTLRAYAPLRPAQNLLPFWWMAVLAFFAPLMRRLDRLGRHRADLSFRGVVIIALAVLAAFAVARAVGMIEAEIGTNGLIAFLLLLSTLQAGTIWRAMRYKDVAGLMATYRVTEINDAHTLNRLMIGHATVAFDKMLILPLIWFLLFGLTGALVAATLAALAWQVRMTPPQTAFGDTLQAIEKLTGAVPNWIAGAFLMLAAFIAPKTSVLKTLSGLHPDKPKVNYETGGYAMAAMAWGLKITLGGPLLTWDGTTLSWGWIGPENSTARAERSHVLLAFYWLAMAHLGFLAALLSASLWSGV